MCCIFPIIALTTCSETKVTKLLTGVKKLCYFFLSFLQVYGGQYFIELNGRVISLHFSCEEHVNTRASHGFIYSYTFYSNYQKLALRANFARPCGQLMGHWLMEGPACPQLKALRAPPYNLCSPL